MGVRRDTMDGAICAAAAVIEDSMMEVQAEAEHFLIHISH